MTASKLQKKTSKVCYHKDFWSTLSLRCLVLIYINSQLFSFVECGHKMSKNVDGHNSDNAMHLGLHINPIAVVSESCTKMLQ